MTQEFAPTPINPSEEEAALAAAEAEGMLAPVEPDTAAPMTAAEKLAEAPSSPVPVDPETQAQLDVAADDGNPLAA